MASAVKLRSDYSASDLRRLAAASRHANQSRRLLSLAAVLDGMIREQAARIGGMDRQTLRDWVPSVQRPWSRWPARHPLEGESAPADKRAIGRVGGDRRDRPGSRCPRRCPVASHRLEDGHRTPLWRCLPRTHPIGKILKVLGFSHISARPKHPGQSAAIMDAFKKTSPQR